MFNEKDISKAAEEWGEDYAHSDWERLGWDYGKTLLDASKSNQVGDDPKREYYEKLGAQFASGFFIGTEVAEFDEIDLYECLHAEPEAVEYFYKADETLKEAFIKKDMHEAVKALDELIGFLVEMVMEDYPHTKTQVCKRFEGKDAHWDDLKRIMEELKSDDRTL